MLPTIGLMVGVIGLTVCLYIVTRMLQVFVPDPTKGPNALVALGAVITILMAAIAAFILVTGMGDLLKAGSSSAGLGG